MSTGDSAQLLGLLLPALGTAGLSFRWLLKQTIGRHRTGWISAVVLPAALALGSAIVMFPQIAGALSAGGDGSLLTRLAALASAAAAGFLFDLGSSLQRDAGDMQASRSRWPLTLWGVGAVLFVAAPAASILPQLGALLERSGGAVGLVAVVALLGQAASWAMRLRRSPARQEEAPPAAPADRPVSPFRRIGSLVAGGAAAALAVILTFPRHGDIASSLSVGGVLSSVSAGGAQAPPNVLLVSAGTPLSNGPISIFDRRTGTARALAPQGSRARWSPDGTRMAYGRTEPGEIWVAAADGSGARRLAGPFTVVHSITWSADSQRIYFTPSDGFFPGSLQVISAAGGTPETVLPVSEGVEVPEVSPDGSTLAYVRGTDTTQSAQPPRELKVLDLVTREARALVSDPTATWNVTGMAWTRDGQALIISSSDTSGKQFQLERIDIADARRRALGAPVDHYLSSFSTAPDSGGVTMLASPRVGGNPDPSRAAEIWVVDPTTGGRQRLQTDGSAPPASIAASPNSGSGGAAASTHDGRQAVGGGDGQAVPQRPEQAVQPGGEQRGAPSAPPLGPWKPGNR